MNPQQEACIACLFSLAVDWNRAIQICVGCVLIRLARARELTGGVK